MNLIIFASDFYPTTSGGALERWKFCQQTADRGHEVTVFTPKQGGTPGKEIVKNVKIIRPFKSRPDRIPPYATFAVITRILFSILLFFYMLIWLRDKKVDGIYSTSHEMHWVAKSVSLIYGINCISYISYTVSIRSGGGFSPKFVLERINFRFFMGEVVFCRTTRIKHLLELYTTHDVRIIHGVLDKEKLLSIAESVNVTETRKECNIYDDEIFMVYVARLVPLKNPVATLNVISQLPEQYKLVIIGDGPEFQKLQNKITKHGLGDRVVLAGELPHEKTLKIIASADVLLVTSHVESYCTVALEALSYGNKVFATEVGVLPEIDHTRLYLGEIDEFPEKIQDSNVNGTSNFKLDMDTIEEYSMNRYTNEVLEAFRSLAS